jgi:tetratricopeptide (TPR) repeat protein
VGGTKYTPSPTFSNALNYNQTTQKDFNTLDITFSFVARYIEYDYKQIKIADDNFNKSFLETTIDKLPITEQDIIVFTVNAHGYHNEKEISPFTDNISVFPTPIIDYKYWNCQDQACQSSALLSFEKFVLNIFNTKKPQMLIALADACNQPIPSRSILIDDGGNVGRAALARILNSANAMNYTTNGIEQDKVRDFFVNRKGLLLISSTSVGENAGMLVSEGSVYTKTLCNTIKDILSSDAAITFKEFTAQLSKIPEPVLSTKTKFNEPPPRQTPKVDDKTGYAPMIAANAGKPIKPATPAFPPGSVEDYLQRGRNLMKQGKKEEARLLYLEALNKYPNDIDIKLAVFWSEAALGYEKLTTIADTELYDIVSPNTKLFENKGYAYLQYIIGISYARGINGFKKDIKQAVYWLSHCFNNADRYLQVGVCQVLSRLGNEKCIEILGPTLFQK